MNSHTKSRSHHFAVHQCHTCYRFWKVQLNLFWVVGGNWVTCRRHGEKCKLHTQMPQLGLNPCPSTAELTTLPLCCPSGWQLSTLFIYFFIIYYFFFFYISRMLENIVLWNCHFNPIILCNRSQPEQSLAVFSWDQGSNAGFVQNTCKQKCGFYSSYICQNST